MIDVPLSIIGSTNVTTGDWSLAAKDGDSLNTGVTLSGETTTTPKLTFAGAGAQTATLEWTATADSPTEPPEVVTIALGPDGSGANGFDSFTDTNVGGGADPHSSNNQFDVRLEDPGYVDIGLAIIESDGSTMVSEAAGAGHTDTYTVALNSAPAANVILTAKSDDTEAATVSPATFTFTPTDYGTARTVTVTGVDDRIDNPEDKRTVTIIHPASSTDPNYNASSAGNVTVTVVDDDVASVTVSPTSLALTELGDSSTLEKTYTVVLATDPTADVTITVTNGDSTAAEVDTNSGVTGNQDTLTFTPGSSGNWNIPQTVTVRALNDGDIANESFNLTHGAAVTDTSNPYHDIAVSNVAVTTTDVGHKVSVSKTDLKVYGNNIRDPRTTYTVVLTSDPGGKVEVQVSSNRPAARVFPPRLAFDSSNWNKPQKVTVTGMVRSVEDPSQSVTITHTVQTPTTNYPSSTMIPPVRVTAFRDDDRPTVRGLSFLLRKVVTEGEKMSFDITLTKALEADVTIPFILEDLTTSADDYTAPNSITITAGQTRGTFTIDTTDDKDLEEESERFRLLIDQENLPETLTFSQNPQFTFAIGTIRDNEEGVKITMSARNAEVVEGESVDVSFKLDKALDKDVQIPLKLIDRSTSKGDDYTDPAPGNGTADFTVTIPMGGTGGSVTVQTLEDNDFEGQEIVEVQLSNDNRALFDQGIELGNQQERITRIMILDDDGVILTETNDSTVVNESGTSDRYSVKMNDFSMAGLDTTITIIATAGEGLQVSAAPQTEMNTSRRMDFNRTNNATDQWVHVHAVDDDVDNPGGFRTGRVTHRAEIRGGESDGGLAIEDIEVTIQDDDPTTVTLAAAATGNMEEGQTKELTITLGRGLVDGETMTVPLSFGGTATRGTDYTMTGAAADGVQYNNLDNGSATVVFTGPKSGATATTATITLSAASDGVVESTAETVDIDLGTTTNTGLKDGGGC